tara:strand:- start:11595 stop:12020 length:426 start_codon:yes stop_codon:yes gene_type:complete
MNKHEIYKNFRSKFIGYIVLQQHYNNEKALTKTNISNLVRLTYLLWHSKYYLLEGGWQTGTLYSVNRRTAVECLGSYMGNHWASFCNLNKKIGLLDICSHDYGHENVYVSLLDTRLRQITMDMYKELEDLHTSEIKTKECA